MFVGKMLQWNDVEITDEMLREELTAEQYERFCDLREHVGMEEAIMTLPAIGMSKVTSIANARIKELRVQHGLSQADMANIMNVSQKEWWRYEQDGYNPNMLTLLYIGLFFNVSFDWIFGVLDDPKPLLKTETNVNGYTLANVKKAKAEKRKIEPV